MRPPSLTSFARLSVAAAFATILLKSAAYYTTGSVGLLSDAVESLVNLVGALMALSMLRVAERPADTEHSYGHGKAEYFSSGVEGTLILLAAISIAIAATQRLLTPKPIEQVGLGLAISTVASLVNLGAGILILRAGRRHHSITLEANAHHLLTDVWTSVGVIAGVGLVFLTGWHWLDPLVALVVAANIVWTGVGIVRRSISGLMDAALSPADQQTIRGVLDTFRAEGVDFHAIRSRQSGAWRFASFHVLVPGHWTVQHGHELVERIEEAIRKALPNITVFTHLEPLDDPRSFDDIELSRTRSGQDAPPR